METYVYPTITSMICVAKYLEQIAKNLQLPLGADAPKMQIQEVIHAVEELYFFRKYEEALDFMNEVLTGSEGVDDETRQLLTTYHEKCQKKLDPSSYHDNFKVTFRAYSNKGQFKQTQQSI